MKYPVLFFPALFSFLALSGCDNAQPAGNGQTITEVSVINVATTEVPLTTDLKGRTVASLSAEVRPQVSGIIKERLFEEGSVVSKGQQLYQIDDATYRAAYNEAAADLHSAQATVKSSKLKDERYAGLVKIEGISQQDADDAHADYLDAVASVEKYKAALATAKIDLDYTKVRAEIDGRIGISSVTPGALVTADQDTALTTINNLDPMYVDMTQSSKDLLTLRRTLARQGVSAGTTEVSLTLEDGTQYSQKGSLKAREVAVDEATGTVTLRAEFPNPDGVLMPGMFVTAEINEAVESAGILVPQQGIAHDNLGNAYALLVNSSSQVVKQTVVTSRAIGNQWLIASGLKAGDKVIVEGSSKVAEGSTVKAVTVEVNKSGGIDLGRTSAADQSGNTGAQ